MQNSTGEDVLSCVVLPDDAEATLRRSLHIEGNRPLRIACLEGPGDLFGTFTHWAQGRHDPRVPIITYSAMIYSLTAKLNAQALLLTESPLPTDMPTGHVTFQTLPRDRRQSGVRWHLAEAAYARKAARIVNAWKPDIVVVHSDIPASIFRRLPGLRILTMHNTLWTIGQDMPRTFKRRVLLQRRISNLRAVDAAVCTSEECARQLKLFLPQLDCVVPHPQVPLDAQINSVRSANRPLRNVVYLGRVEVSKGVLDLVGAFAAVAGDNPDLHLHFLGSGGADAALRAAVQNAQLTARCTLHGHSDASKVHSILAQSDLLVCPTRSEFPEGLAVVPFEAALHGVPSLVSTAVPAAEALPNCTITFPVDQPDALAAALRRLVSDRTLHARLCEGTSGARDRMVARKWSWGSQLYSAVLLGAESYRKNRYRPSAF